MDVFESDVLRYESVKFEYAIIYGKWLLFVRSIIFAHVADLITFWMVGPVKMCCVVRW